MDAMHKKEVPALFVGFGLIIVVILYFAFRETMTPSTEAPVTAAPAAETVNLPTISIDEAKKQYLSAKPTATFIDVRTSDLFMNAHIPRSLSVPSEALSTYMPQQESSLIVVWAAADRTLMKQVVDTLGGKGVPFVFLNGGIEAWVGAGGQVITKGDQTSFVDMSKVTLVSLDDWKKLVENADAPSTVVDVRTKDLYAKSHIAKSVNIPLSELETRTNDIPKGVGIAVIGSTSLETFQGAVRLFDLNVFTAKALNGSFDDWTAKGFPTESSK